MDPLPATAQVLQILADLGDDDVEAHVDWMCATILGRVPRADALAIWFSGEDLTLVFVADASAPSSAPQVKRSSISLRIAAPGRLIAVLTVYSVHADAFTGQAGALERALGAERASAVHDVDLDFTARRQAEAAPAKIRAQLAVDTAVGLLMDTHGFTVDGAEDWLQHVARSSGRTPLEVAHLVVAARSSRPAPPPAGPGRGLS